MNLCVHTKIIPGPTKICHLLMHCNYVVNGICFPAYVTSQDIMNYELYNILLILSLKYLNLKLTYKNAL